MSSYDIAQILNALPHRYPLLLVDKVVDLYRRTLEHFQEVKRQGLERDAEAANEPEV